VANSWYSSQVRGGPVVADEDRRAKGHRHHPVAPGGFPHAEQAKDLSPAGLTTIDQILGHRQNAVSLRQLAKLGAVADHRVPKQRLAGGNLGGGDRHDLEIPARLAMPFALQLADRSNQGRVVDDCQLQLLPRR
jgi:hypothetical protein